MGLPISAAPYDVPSLDGYNQLPLLSLEYQRALRRATILKLVTNTNPKPVRVHMGSTIRIPIMPQVRSRRVEVNYENEYSSPQPDYIDVDIDRIRAFDFKTIDVQDLQSQILGTGKTWGDAAGVNMGEDIEEEIFGELAALIPAANQGVDAGIKYGGTNLGSITAPRTVSSAEGATFILDAILDLNVAVSENDVEETDRFIIAPDKIMARLKSSLRKANEMGDAKSMLYGRTVGSIDHTTFLSCNRLPVCAKVNGLPVYPVLCLHKSAVAYHVQGENIERIRLERTPSWGYRSECVYGYKAVQPKAMAIGYYAVS